MIEQHNSFSSEVTSSSLMHNEHIERLWRDVFCCVGSIYYGTFYNLENGGQFNLLNEVDLYILFTLCAFALTVRGAVEQNIYPSQPQLLHSCQSLGDTDESVLPEEQVSVPRI